MVDFPPKHLTIACPLVVGKRPRGNTSFKDADPQYTVRMPPEIVASIDKAAGLLGITRSEFMRWVNYAASQELIASYGLHIKDKYDNRKK